MSTIIKVKCTDQVLAFENTPVIASGGLGEDFVSFEFCSKWDGLAKTAVFWRTETDAYHVILDESGSCAIPPEVLTQEGVIHFGVFGVGGDGEQRTSDVLRYTIVKGVITEGTKPSEPTQDIYTQLLAQYAEVRAVAVRAADEAAASAAAAKASQEAAEKAGEYAASVAGVAQSAVNTANAAATAAGSAVETANAAKDTANSHASRHKAGGSDPLTAVDIDAVATVNGIAPDAQGNVKLGAGDVGAVSQKGLWTIYSKLDLLGLSDATVTMDGIYNALPNYSEIIVAVSTSWADGITPSKYGTLHVVKIYSGRAFATFDDNGKRKYFGVWKGDTFGGWKELATTDYALPRDGSAAMTGNLKIVKDVPVMQLISPNAANGSGYIIKNATETADYHTSVVDEDASGTTAGLGIDATAQALYAQVNNMAYPILHTGNLASLGVAQIASGTYEGTGVYGNSIAQAISLTFPFVPKLVIVNERENSFCTMFLINDSPEAIHLAHDPGSNGLLSAPVVNVVWDDANKKVSWFAGNEDNMLNASGEKYHWVAFG